MDAEVEQFMAVTGTTSQQVARGYLEISNGDSMQAIQLFFENPELQSSFTQPQPPAVTSSSRPSVPPTTTTSSRNRTRTTTTGREDAHGVIHLDSDDNDDDDNELDIPMTDDDFAGIHDDDIDDDVHAVARTAQEEEDAAMARRLQEEMYGENPGSSGDGVRAPIARRTETLAAPDPMWAPEHDRHDALLESMRWRGGLPQGGTRNPFSQSVWDDPEAPPVPASTRPSGIGGPGAGAGAGAGGEISSRSRRLADLFRPPHELMSHLTWDAAREAGKEEKKWILVNLQDMSDFNCQSLNRDHWKNENIQTLVREHFIFLQYEKGDPRADSYVTFYFPNQAHENPDNYPHVSIIDPRTGEQVKVWSGLPFPPPAELHADLVEFLDRYSLSKNSKNPVPKSKPKTKHIDYGRMSEEEMMRMALEQSLAASNGGGGSGSGSGGGGAGGSGSNVQDPDALTKSNPDISSGGKGKGRETDDDDDPTESPQPTNSEDSAFARISATSPHAEPAPDPATTTRIQFRHSGGRVIRRFAVTDPVRRLYEWLKAEPLEGKEGSVPFELKTMPAGRDLIGELDSTVEEAGLKNGTVMIEYIED